MLRTVDTDIFHFFHLAARLNYLSLHSAWKTSATFFVLLWGTGQDSGSDSLVITHHITLQACFKGVVTIVIQLLHVPPIRPISVLTHKQPSYFCFSDSVWCLQTTSPASLWFLWQVFKTDEHETTIWFMAAWTQLHLNSLCWIWPLHLIARNRRYVDDCLLCIVHINKVEPVPLQIQYRCLQDTVSGFPSIANQQSYCFSFSNCNSYFHNLAEIQYEKVNATMLQ